MSHRFMIFIDGANLQALAKILALKFESYESLVEYLFKRSFQCWSGSFAQPNKVNAQLVRAYLYSVGSMDEWDLHDSKAISFIRSLFDKNQDVKHHWEQLAITSSGQISSSDEKRESGWELYLTETRRWYDTKVRAFEGVQKFLQAVENSTSFIEIDRNGHWKVDLLNHESQEKGVDTGLAVSMATATEGYDVAILASGDFDLLPALKFVKSTGRQVGLVDLYSSSHSQSRGPNLSKYLLRDTDFVVGMSDEELLGDKIATRQSPKLNR